MTLIQLIQDSALNVPLRMKFPQTYMFPGALTLQGNHCTMYLLKRQGITNANEDVEKREPLYTVEECKLVQPLRKTVWINKLQMNYSINYK